MAKLKLLIALIFIANSSILISAQAQSSKDWKALGSIDTGQFFYDPSTIKGSSDERKISIKVNFTGEPKDGAKSRLLEYSIFCQDKTTLVELIRNYSEVDLSGDEKIISRPYGNEKRLAKPNTLGMKYIDTACDNKTIQTVQPSLPTTPKENKKPYKFIPKLSPEEINLSVIKKGINQTDLDIFLTMYGFIWSMNDWLSDTPPNVNSTRWMNGAREQHQRLVQYRNNARLTLNKFEETISNLAGNIGLTNAQFKQAIGIVEVFIPPVCSGCEPGYKTLKIKQGGLVTENLGRNDISSNGIDMGMRAFYDYRTNPGSDSAKNNKGHPGFELTPSAFFDFYSKWIPAYYLEQSKLSRLQTAAASTEERLEKQQLDADQATAKRQEEERKQQDFLNSPEGKKQIAKEQEEERLRQKQFAKDFPFYAVVSCSGHFPVHACFSGNVGTELELRNGNDYKMYTNVDIMLIRQNQGGITFNLRNKFDLKMQNSSDSLILNLKIYNTATNALAFEQSAARFGVIRFSK